MSVFWLHFYFTLVWWMIARRSTQLFALLRNENSFSPFLIDHLQTSVRRCLCHLSEDSECLNPWEIESDCRLTSSTEVDCLRATLWGIRPTQLSEGSEDQYGVGLISEVARMLSGSGWNVFASESHSVRLSVQGCSSDWVLHRCIIDAFQCCRLDPLDCWLKSFDNRIRDQLRSLLWRMKFNFVSTKRDRLNPAYRDHSAPDFSERIKYSSVPLW